MPFLVIAPPTPAELVAPPFPVELVELPVAPATEVVPPPAFAAPPTALAELPTALPVEPAGVTPLQPATRQQRNVENSRNSDRFMVSPRVSKSSSPNDL